MRAAANSFRWSLCALLVQLPQWVAAAEPAAPRRFAAPPAAEAVPAPAAGLAQVTLSLLLVLGAVFAAAWLMRRLRGPGRAAAEGAIVVLADRVVGSRERVVLLQVGSEKLLVGVAPGNVRMLHACRPDQGGSN
jgi:flagellar protein FliO/FliZ